MEPHPVSETLYIAGMTCANCAERIEKTLAGTDGVRSAAVRYNSATAKITYDAGAVSRAALLSAIETLGYKAADAPPNGGRTAPAQAAGVLLILVSVYMLLQHSGLAVLFQSFPQAERGMGYGMLFVVGALTSVHCVGMCGGICLSQCLRAPGGEPGRAASLRPPLLYNIGRVISYTLVGAVVGALGSVISFSGAAKGVVQIAAGVFMVVMGLNMLGIFPSLRALAPRLPPGLARRIRSETQSSTSPLYIGLLNGLMPCGPLQAMQLYALSTADPVRGALSMLLFSLGTVPLMFGFGALSSLLSGRFSRRVMAAGAGMVAVMGLFMLQNGMSLSGVSLFPGASGGSSYRASVEGGVQTVTTPLSPGRYEAITVEAGVPVVWTITADEGTINGCNNRILIPEYGIEKTLEYGDNVIEFVPAESGTVRYSCWMGMIRSNIIVEENREFGED